MEIEYTVVESDLDGYTATYTNVTDDLGNLTGIEVTNTHEIKKRDIQVSKLWADHQNYDRIRPLSVTVYLVKKVGKGTVDVKDVEPIVLSKENKWKGEWKDLPYNENGVEIQYSVREVKVPAYSWSVRGDMVKGFIVRNFHTWRTGMTTGDEIPVYPFVLGGVGLLALAAALLLNRKKKSEG